MNNVINVVFDSFESSDLGSITIELNKFNSFKDILCELNNKGFHDFFIKDIIGFPNVSSHFNLVSPEDTISHIYASDILNDLDKYKKMLAFIQIRGYEDWIKLVDFKKDDWDQDIYLYDGYSWEDYAIALTPSSIFKDCPQIRYFVDFYNYGKYLGIDYAYRFSFPDIYDEHNYFNGILEICN